MTDTDRARVRALIEAVRAEQPGGALSQRALVIAQAARLAQTALDHSPLGSDSTLLVDVASVLLVAAAIGGPKHRHMRELFAEVEALAHDACVQLEVAEATGRLLVRA
jgi:hypothetical protein